MISRRIVRNFMSSAVRRSSHDEPEGIPGANLPFSINNRYKLFAYATVFLASGFGAPFLIVRHQMLK